MTDTLLPFPKEPREGARQPAWLEYYDRDSLAARAALKALVPYARHISLCTWWSQMPDEAQCSCGLSDLLAHCKAGGVE